MKAMTSRLFKNLFLEKKKIDNRTLKKWNLMLAVLFAAQGVALLLFSASRELPINVLFLTNDALQAKLTGHTVTALAVHQLFTVNIVYILAAMFFIASAASAFVATLGRRWYEAGLQKGTNAVRWIECVVTGFAVAAVAGLLAGVYDAGTLALFLCLMILMSFLGMTLDAMAASQKAKGSLGGLLPVGALVAGLAPWLIIALYVGSTHVFGDTHTAGMVYLVYIAGIVSFCVLAFNTYLSNQKQGSWSQYSYGESLHMVLSFVAMSAFAWLVFVALLHP